MTGPLWLIVAGVGVAFLSLAGVLLWGFTGSPGNDRIAYRCAWGIFAGLALVVLGLLVAVTP